MFLFKEEKMGIPVRAALSAVLVIFAAFRAVPAGAGQVPGELLVRFSPEALRGANLETLELEAFSGLGAKVLTRYSLVPGLVRVLLPSHVSVTQGLARLSRSPWVQYAQPNFLRKPMALGRAPGQLNDVMKDRPYPPIPPQETPPAIWVKDPKSYYNAGLSQNRTREVFRKYEFHGNAQTVIAVVDTGVDYTHPDLRSNLWRNPGESGADSKGNPKETNGIDDDGNGYVDDVIGYDFSGNTGFPFDDFGHGTHVSGIAAAVGGNGFGMTGQCPRCSIMALKFISKDGSGSDADAIRALEYATRMGAQVINSSWGGNEESPALFDAFQATSAAGIFNAVAAGNDGEDLTFFPEFPARYRLPGLVTVAALYETSSLIPAWSNYGPLFVHSSSAGVEVTSTVPGGGFAPLSGTSMASPNIAGCAALIRSYRPDLSADEVAKLLGKHVLLDPSSMAKVLYRGRPDMLRIFNELN